MHQIVKCGNRSVKTMTLEIQQVLSIFMILPLFIYILSSTDLFLFFFIYVQFFFCELGHVDCVTLSVFEINVLWK